MNESIRGRYWLCQTCREWVPDEQSVCGCGRSKYHSRRAKVPIVIPYKNADSSLAKLLKTDQMDFQSKTIGESIKHIDDNRWGH